MDTVRLVVDQAGGRPQAAPVPAYDGQDVGVMRHQLPERVPPVQLFHHGCADVTVLIGAGMDGVVIDRLGRPLPASTVYTAVDPDVGPDPAGLPPERPGLPAVFVGFDAAWSNWYHWNVFALRRMALADRLLPPEVPFAVPVGAMRRPAWRHALDAVGLAHPIIALEPGRYPVQRLHSLRMASPVPTDVVFLEALHEAVPALDLPQTRLIAVRRAGNARLDGAEQAALSSVAARLGMEEVDLAEHGFDSQRGMFAGARLVVAAHGSALANLMHSRPGTRVLELNRRLEGEAAPRPWFYQIAAMRGLTYMTLDADAGEVTEARVKGAITRLLEG